MHIDIAVGPEISTKKLTESPHGQPCEQQRDIAILSSWRQLVSVIERRTPHHEAGESNQGQQSPRDLVSVGTVRFSQCLQRKVCVQAPNLVLNNREPSSDLEDPSFSQAPGRILCCCVQYELCIGPEQRAGRWQDGRNEFVPPTIANATGFKPLFYQNKFTSLGKPRS